MKLNYAATNAEVRGGGFRTSYNLIRVHAPSNSHQLEDSRSTSPHVLKCSSIQQAKMMIKSAQEGRHPLSREMFRKTKENLLSQTDRPWPFKEEEAGSNAEVKNKSNLQELLKTNEKPIAQTNLPALHTLQEENTLPDERDKFLPVRSQRETVANEVREVISTFSFSSSRNSM